MLNNNIINIIYNIIIFPSCLDMRSYHITYKRTGRVGRDGGGHLLFALVQTITK